MQSISIKSHSPIFNDLSIDKSIRFLSIDYPGLHQRVEEHKRSTIGNHVKDKHGKDPEAITSNFKMFEKSQSKLDCLIFEMLFIHELKPKLNKQSDSILAKLSA